MKLYGLYKHQNLDDLQYNHKKFCEYNNISYNKYYIRGYHDKYHLIYHLLEKNPGETIIYSLISSRIVPETISANGGKPLRSRVGHSFIKSMMAESGAVFAGEHSGHFYFEEFWGADSGALAALHTLAALGATEAGTTLSELLSPYAKYVQSGEINTKVSDIQEVISKVKSNYLNHPDLLEIDELDGLMVISKKWWFNLRGSNTEPLLRLNVEGDTGAIMTFMRDEVLEMIAKLK
jgi:phosphomannomutase